ncbi:hypothetical protein [Methanobrevibacter curvatus]|jgi:hypothetical protein|uniref:Uncharacterized protein n=1 Tax=Methanobrevibacter curvatus TaxID=49547 RepID=A0A166CH59_9EURY|nr:hypothetical protein [Methanobrevibacter curvatus]KZX14297.1 hypothetical protein MBCUR_05210 [Methanobrevibacter curvatus]MDR3062540.1 hypothetical protein [Methanobrevibacter sp.]
MDNDGIEFEEQEYEMKLPNGVGEKMLADAISNYNVKLKHTNFGPVLVGKIHDLEDAKDFLIKSLNEMFKKFENKK